MYGYFGKVVEDYDRDGIYINPAPGGGEKLALNSKLRSMDSEKEHLLEQLEEESQTKTLEKSFSTASQQLDDARRKAEKENEQVEKLEEQI